MMERATTTLATTLADLAARWHECFTSYPFTPAGERLAQGSAAERDALRANYAAIIQAAERGDDVTDRVLDGLLPHAPTAANQARGVWIAQTGVARGDARQMLQGRQREPRDWHALSAAILAFLQRASGDPRRLRVACAVFSDDPATKGVQSGLLTPALHALRPDDCCVMNRATAQLIASATGLRPSLRLVDFPALNDAGLRLLRDLAPHLGSRDRLPGLELTDHLAIFARWLASVKRWPTTAPRAWRVAIPESGAWALWRRDGYIALPASDAARLAEGDRVIAHRAGVELVDSGAVAGPMYPGGEPGQDRVPIRWDSGAAQTINKPGWRGTLAPLSAKSLAALPAPTTNPNPLPDETPAQREIPHAVREASAPYFPDIHIPIAIGYTIEECATETNIDEERIAAWRDALEHKGQVVLYGPPGTGKTFIAARLARLVSGAHGLIEQVQFHPGYAYEDFIQGVRPRADAAGTMRFPLEPGRLLEFCAQARQRKDPCVLIVDELNRANLAQVLGEALHALEYRDQPIQLAAGGELTIPANVRLIGTMNTADRSIAHVDLAVRRRFAWLHLPPDYAVVRRYHAGIGHDVAPLVALLERVNRTIADPDRAIGISYFLTPDLPDRLEAIWRSEIEPLLQETFFDRPERSEALRWSAVRASLTAPRRRSRG